jgi:YHS domain-containing protein
MEENNTVVLYKYSRGGKEYYTPNEQIASLRSDTGVYYVIEDIGNPLVFKVP